MDVSDFRLGIILLQKDNENREQVIAYTSCALSKTEHNYTITKKKCLAIIWGVKMF